MKCHWHKVGLTLGHSKVSYPARLSRGLGITLTAVSRRH